MKNKKIILAILSITLIIILSTISFAASFEEAVENYKNRANTVSENVVSNSTETTLTEKPNEEIKNEVETEPEELPGDVLAIPEDNKEEENEEDNTITFKETILEDLYNFSDKKIEYKKIYVDANAYIMSDEDLILENVKIDGNLFAMSNNITLKNVLIEGSVYLLGENINIDGHINSVYGCGNKILVSSDSDILREARIVGNEITFEGTVQRNAYLSADIVRVTEDAKILGNCNIEASNTEISEDAKVYGENNVSIVEETETVFDKMDIYKGIIAETVIILIVSIFILNTSPKFIDVNGRLRLRDFFKAFFTGLLEIILVIAILILLSYIGYGIGFGFALFILACVLVYFGKMLFIISAGIRLCGKREYVSRVKAFFMIILVLVVVEAFSLLQLTGIAGFVASLIINLVLGITGFGSIVRVILTPIKRNKPIKVNKPKKSEMKVEVYDSYVEDALKEKEKTETEVSKNDEHIEEQNKEQEIKDEPKEEKIEDVNEKNELSEEIKENTEKENDEK